MNKAVPVPWLLWRGMPTRPKLPTPQKWYENKELDATGIFAPQEDFRNGVRIMGEESKEKWKVAKTLEKLRTRNHE